MTTPTDDIAGLSERLRERLGPSRTVTVGPGLYEDVSEAATAIDALKARVKELENESTQQEYNRLEWIKRAESEKSRALRAEQERDEAYERAAKHFEDSEDLVWCKYEVADDIRQLAAGPEKEGK